MSWFRRAEPEPQCPPDCVKCEESASIDPDYTPDPDQTETGS